jgi:hypothetical protein
MARQNGSGVRGSMSVRTVSLLALVLTGVLAFAVPALADDTSGDGHGSTSRHSSDLSDNDDSNSTASTVSAKPSSRSGSKSSSAKSSQKSAPKDDANLIKGTPCTKAARACVELKTQRAWLINAAGQITDGPVKVSSGGPGEETPVGTFNVQWKDKNHKSTEVKEADGQGAPMPYSVFFANGGVAFHGGSLERASAGCVHLDDADAIDFYNTLQLGDQVQVH